MPENKVWYLGVDPGSAKTGFAWVEADGRIKKVAVLATETLPEVLPQILGSAPAAVILGNGTNCDSIKKMLMEVTTVIKILNIEEGAFFLYRKLDEFHRTKPVEHRGLPVQYRQEKRWS